MLRKQVSYAWVHNIGAIKVTRLEARSFDDVCQEYLDSPKGNLIGQPRIDTFFDTMAQVHWLSYTEKDE